MPAAPTVRPAHVGDAAALAALATTLGYPAEEGLLAARLQRLSGQPAHRVQVAVVDDSVAAWVHAIATETLESGLRVEIVGLVVAEAFRRRGLGRRLVADAEHWAAELGAAAVVVRSNTQRAESHAFYPALGFAVAKTQTVYCKPVAPRRTDSAA